VRALTSPRISVASGGLACIAGAALVAWRLPAFARYTADQTAVVEAANEARAATLPSGESGDFESFLLQSRAEPQEDSE
jgi:hypothetical protein